MVCGGCGVGACHYCRGNSSSSADDGNLGAPTLVHERGRDIPKRQLRRVSSHGAATEARDGGGCWSTHIVGYSLLRRLVGLPIQVVVDGWRRGGGRRLLRRLLEGIVEREEGMGTGSSHHGRWFRAGRHYWRQCARTSLCTRSVWAPWTRSAECRGSRGFGWCCAGSLVGARRGRAWHGGGGLRRWRR